MREKNISKTSTRKTIFKAFFIASAVMSAGLLLILWAIMSYREE